MKPSRNSSIKILDENEKITSDSEKIANIFNEHYATLGSKVQQKNPMYIWPQPVLPLLSFPCCPSRVMGGTTWEGQQGKDRPQPTQEENAYFTPEGENKKGQDLYRGRTK